MKLDHTRRLLVFLAFALIPTGQAAGSPHREGKRADHCAERASIHAVLDFQELVIRPRDVELPVTKQSRQGIPRTAVDLTRALQRGRALLGHCYGWARFAKPELAGTLQASLEIDFWGVVSRVSIAAIDPSFEKLAGCTKDVLLHAALDPGCGSLFRRFTPRTTTAHLAIHFQPSGHSWPASSRRRPVSKARSSPCPPKLCERPVEELAHDDLDLGTLDIDEGPIDECMKSALEEYEGKLSDWIRGGRRGHRPRIVPCVAAEASPVCPGFDKEKFWQAINYSLPAYRACWKDALARTPRLRGAMSFRLEVDPRGYVCSVQMASTKDLEGEMLLESCLREALADIWFDTPLHSPVGVRVYLELEPTPAMP